MINKMRLMAGLLAGSLSLTAAGDNRLAVEAFDYSTVMTSVQAVFGTHVNIGEGIRALMVKRVVTDGKFTVVERKKVDTLLKEQDFGASGRVRQGTQAQIGNISGAQLAVMGDIVVFGRDDKNRGGSLGGIGGGVFGRIGGGKREEKAVVVLNYRVVNIETSEIIHAGEARGESKRSSLNVGGFLGSWKGAGGASVDMSAANFQETIIGEAVMAAVDQLAVDLNDKSDMVISSMPEISVEARVAVANGNTLIISAGSENGVTEGMTFQVLRVGQEIKDPVSGEVLDVMTEPLGQLVINSVRDKIATGTYTGPAAEVGDMVRSQ